MNHSKIGILDFNHIATRCVQLMIKNHFHANVYTYDNSSELLDDLQAQQFDLIIVEYNMEEIQGDQIFHFLNSRSSNTKIIFWSTPVIESLRDNLIKGGALDFIIKSDESINQLKDAIHLFFKDKENFQYRMKKVFNNRMDILNQLGGHVKKYVSDDSLDDLADKIDRLKYDKDY